MRVAQKVVVTNSAGHVLALRRSITDENRPATWDLPGGQLEEGETLQENASREILEETGLSVAEWKLVDADARYNKEQQFWLVLFSTAKTNSTKVYLSEEHSEYTWMTREEFLRNESSERMRAFFLKHIELG